MVHLCTRFNLELLLLRVELKATKTWSHRLPTPLLMPLPYPLRPNLTDPNQLNRIPQLNMVHQIIMSSHPHDAHTLNHLVPS